MSDKMTFHTLFQALKFSQLDEEFAYKIYNNIIKRLMARGNIDVRYLNPAMILNYIYAEYFYLIGGLNSSEQRKLQNDESFIKNLCLSLCDKIVYNEILTFKNSSYLSKYSPVSATLNFYINFIIDRLLKLQPTYEEKFVLDMLFKAFSMMKSTINLLNDGFETEAFSTWRTIHEIESVIAILDAHPEVVETYARHIDYIRAFRNEIDDKDAQDKIFEEMKSKMREHELKSKDLKKFIEYGWLYAIENVNELYPTMKLNFRNGVEMIANLSNYSKLYEMSSEIAHSSPILIYSNKEYFAGITILCIYETFLRLEAIFIKILNHHPETESVNYFAMRENYLETIKQILVKERILFFNRDKLKNNIRKN